MNLHLKLIIFIIAMMSGFWETSTVSRHYPNHSRHVPCSFFQSVNITGDIRFSNGSYLHDGILISHQWIGQYDYIFTTTLTKIRVPFHTRGCICKLKPCINICCPIGTAFKSDSLECQPTDNGLEWPTMINVTSINGSVKQVIINEQFSIIHFRPCAWMYVLNPETEITDKWHLFENGSMFREYDQEIFDINRYCLVPTIGNGNMSVMQRLNPANCNAVSDYTTMNIINAYAMLFSIPFMILTIIVYLIIPELRNQHGKSLVCYLIGLSVGYTMLCCTSFNLDVIIPNLSCKVIGYTAYYFFMAAFLWLNVISFDLWHNFRGNRGTTHNQHENKRFLIYSLYAWGLALIFLIFTWYAQEVADIPDYLKPEIGVTYCWLNMLTWSALIYFFGPILIITVSNVIMFVMTAIKIHRVQREMSKIMSRDGSSTCFSNEKDRYGLFLRLFLVMGVTWSWEILSYFVGNDVAWSRIFYASDICNAIQGFLIFMLFVMKKKVKQLIINKYANKDKMKNTQQPSQSSNRTTISCLSHNRQCSNISC